MSADEVPSFPPVQPLAGPGETACGDTETPFDDIPCKAAAVVMIEVQGIVPCLPVCAFHRDVTEKMAARHYPGVLVIVSPLEDD